MNDSRQLVYVERKIKEDISFFTRRRGFNRTMSFLLTIIPAFLSAVATVSIGVSEKLDLKWAVVVALIASAIAAVVGAWGSFFANRKLWVANNLTLAALRELTSDIHYRKAKEAKPIKQAEVDDFYARYKQAVQEAEKLWHSIYSE